MNNYLGLYKKHYTQLLLLHFAVISPLEKKLKKPGLKNRKS